MNSVKPNIFNYLTKVQKSDLCHYVASFVKKDFDKAAEELANKFIEDQKYYLEINSTRFPWIEEFIDEQEFKEQLELYIKECRKKFKYKQKQKPLYEKQKAYMKEQGKKFRKPKCRKNRQQRRRYLIIKNYAGNLKSKTRLMLKTLQNFP